MTEHADVPPKEALKLARKLWPKMTLQAIYQLRNHMRKKGVDVPKFATGVPTKHPERYANGAAPVVAPAERPKRTLNRTLLPSTQFVLSQPMDMHRDEVAKRAQAAGFKTITATRVSSIRSQHKRTKAYQEAPQQPAQLAIAETQASAPQAPSAAPLARRKRAEAVVLPMGALSTEEADFMGMVLGLGYNRAARLLAQFRVQFFESLKQHTQDND